MGGHRSQEGRRGGRKGGEGGAAAAAAAVGAGVEDRQASGRQASANEGREQRAGTQASAKGSIIAI